MAGTTVSALNGLFKQVYADKIMDLVPTFAYLRKNTTFVKNDQRTGNYYNQPVIVQDEQGVTYAASGSGAYSLNAASTLIMQNAQILGSQITIKATMDQESASRAETGGASAFTSATKLQVANVSKSHNKRIELTLLYGQTSIGTADTSANTSATVTVLQLTTASWADGIWSGMTNATLSLFKTSDGSILNSNAALVITAVDIANRKLTVSGNSADITAIDAHLVSGDADISFYGARTAVATYNEAAGIDKITTNTGSLFGIDAGTYDLWKANTFTCGSAALTQGKVNAAVAQAVGRGLDEDVVLLVNPKTWSNLESDQAALRIYDSSYSKDEAQSGSQKLVYSSQNGRITVVSHMFVKQGEAYMGPLETLIRTGATEVTFDIPGQKDEYFTAMENNMGFYYKSYSNQAPLIETPAKWTKFTNIVNTVTA